MENALNQLISKQKTLPHQNFTLTKLAGQASYREYFRLDFGGGTTAILMKLPVGASSLAEEVTKGAKVADHPFLDVQRYLKKLELPVPDVYAVDLSQGFILLEDIGDKSLESAIAQSNREMTTFFYRQAIDLMLQVQAKTRDHPELTCVAHTRKFDEELLNWEFDHFWEYGLEDRFGKKFPEDERKIFNEISRSISRKIVEMPYGFTHRDFQSRNLHIHQYGMWMIDFQDALMGPLLYDLTALLRDSYIVLDVEQIDQLTSYYAEKADAKNPYSKKPEDVKRDFRLITLQRKLKDTGRFQFIHTVKNNPSFLPCVKPSLGYIKDALEKSPEYGELKEIFEKYLPEFQNK